MTARTTVAPFALLLASGLAHAELPPCELKGQTAFFATFGDNTQIYDGAGSVDDTYAAQYAMPAALLNYAAGLWGNGIAPMDTMIADAAHPGVLQGYTPFDYEDTRSAFLRVDFYFHSYTSEGLSILDEGGFNSNLVVFNYEDRLRSAIYASGDREIAQWVSVRLDLMTGNAFAWEIDEFGNPITDYGQFARFGDDPGDQGQLYYILKAASDGDLFPMLYDDMPLSYMALYGITNGEGECECR